MCSVGLDSRPAVPKWDADLRWAGIRLERFVKARDVADRAGKKGERPQQGYISGGLGGSAKLHGAGKSTAALLASLGAIRGVTHDPRSLAERRSPLQRVFTRSA